MYNIIRFIISTL